MPRRVHISLTVLVGLLLTAIPAHARAASLSEADRTTYKAAFKEFGAKNYAKARLLTGNAADFLPGKVIDWLDLTRNDTEAEFDELARFIERNPDWPRGRTLRRNAERAMPADMPDAKLLAWFEERPPVTVDGALRYLHATERTGDRGRTVELLRDIWINFDFTREQEHGFRERYGKDLRLDDEIARLHRLLWKRSAKAARRQARRIGNDYVALAEARLLLAYRSRGVDRAVKRVPNSLRDDPGFIYDRARWRRRKGRYKGVVELLDPPRPEAPHPEFWWPLRHWAAREALDRKQHGVAYRLSSNHGFERGIGFAEAEWLAGWIALRFVKDPKTAYQHFVRLYEGVKTPVSRARGAYWAGEAAQAKNSTKWAKHWYRLAASHASTYYGQLAAQRLGQTREVVLPASSDSTPVEREAFENKELVRVVRLLGDLGEDQYQRIFLDRLRQTASSPSEFQLTAELALEAGRPDRALRTAKDARKVGIILPEQLYPLPNLPETRKLDPTLVLSVIRQESQFYTEAVSSSGARGLMQLMPATAKRVARKLKLRYRRNKLTANPAFNMRLGEAYLAQLLKRYKGSRLLALAAYNAGPRRVDRWIRNYGDPRKANVDEVDWAERIPFRETRNYVQRILEAVPIYGLRLADRRVDLPLDQATAGFPVND